MRRLGNFVQGSAQCIAGFKEFRARFRRAVTEGDLPIGADADTLASFVQTVNFGLTVQVSTGATRKDCCAWLQLGRIKTLSNDRPRRRRRPDTSRRRVMARCRRCNRQQQGV
jgi:hypothetical protein